MATLYQATSRHDDFRAAQRRKVAVGGKEIAAAAIAREMQNHEAATPLEAWQDAARALVVRELLLQEAQRLQLVAEPRDDGEGRRETDAEALIRTVAETQVVTPQPDEATCLRYYERNRQRFRSADLYEAAHILLPARPEDSSARAAAREQSASICAALRQDPAAFAALAAAHSACPSANSGGNLGQLKRGDTVPEFEAALVRLEPGSFSDPAVETRYGLHIVRLDRRIEGQALPISLVADRIATYLTMRARRTATAQYLAMLAARAGVEGIELPQPAELNTMS